MQGISTMWTYIPIVTVGPITDKLPKVSAHINRPIRWAGILHTLDTVLGETTEPPVSGQQVEEFSNRLNNLEIEEVGPWYDRSQPPKEFMTDAAVLVVDPDPDTSGFIREELVSSGYRVDTATNVTQASELVKKFRYNCIILEMDLPNEESIEFCMRIKQPSDTQRRTAVIILTANRNIVDRVRGSVAGCDAYLSKPVNPNTLMLALEKFLPKWKKK
jgi:two-component system cell cycle response regulator